MMKEQEGKEKSTCVVNMNLRDPRLEAIYISVQLTLTLNGGSRDRGNGRNRGRRGVTCIWGMK